MVLLPSMVAEHVGFSPACVEGKGFAGVVAIILGVPGKVATKLQPETIAVHLRLLHTRVVELDIFGHPVHFCASDQTVVVSR